MCAFGCEGRSWSKRLGGGSSPNSNLWELIWDQLVSTEAGCANSTRDFIGIHFLTV